MRSKTPITTKSRSTLAGLRDELAQQRASTQAHRRLLDHLAQRLTEQERKTSDAIEIAAVTFKRMERAEKETNSLRSRLGEFVPSQNDDLLTREEAALFFIGLSARLKHSAMIDEALERLRDRARK